MNGASLQLTDRYRIAACRLIHEAPSEVAGWTSAFDPCKNEGIELNPGNSKLINGFAELLNFRFVDALEGGRAKHGRRIGLARGNDHPH